MHKKHSFPQGILWDHDWFLDFLQRIIFVKAKEKKQWTSLWQITGKLWEHKWLGNGKSNLGTSRNFGFLCWTNTCRTFFFVTNWFTVRRAPSKDLLFQIFVLSFWSGMHLNLWQKQIQINLSIVETWEVIDLPFGYLACNQESPAKR